MRTEAAPANQRADLPAWVYTRPPPPGSLPPLPSGEQHIEGSSRAYTWQQINNASAPPDWFPDSHPPAPLPVAGGPPGTRACGLCHLVNGAGKPDASSLNGLPVGYMRQQVEDMKHDRRFNAEPRAPIVTMIPVAKLVSDADMQVALDYFHSIGPLSWVKVVEVTRVRKTHPTQRKLLAYDEGNQTEPIGNRVVEIGADPERAEMRDSTNPYIAFVPAGALAKGKRLVETGGGRTQACQTCHGADLRGLGDAVPPIAGRSPTYMARQLYDFKTGARNGANAALMKRTVAKLTDEDVVNIVAYVASLPQ